MQKRVNLEFILKKYNNFIFTMETALYLYGFKGIKLNNYSIATKRKAKVIKNELIKQYFIPDDLYEIGLTRINYIGYEVKLYDTLREHAKDFAMKKADAVDGEIVPRVIKTNIGDIYTTSCITNGTYENGDYLTVASATGFLAKASSGKPASPEMCWQVVDASATMADGTAALKIMRIQ